MSDVSRILNNYSSYATKGANEVGSNGLAGFKSWECYMILKYGKPNQWGVGGRHEYLIEIPIYPSEVQEAISAQWSTQSILGRSPVAAYAGTDLKSVNFSMDLHRDLLTGSFSHTKETLLNIQGASLEKQAAGLQVQSAKGPFDTRTWYTNINKMLQMSCYPQYTTAGLIPPTTYFIFGQMILKGFVNSYSTSWKTPIINTFYAWNSVSISMECYPDSIISAHDIITGPGAASTQNTYNTEYPGASENSNVMARTETRERSNARTNAANKGGTLGGQITQT